MTTFSLCDTGLILELPPRDGQEAQSLKVTKTFPTQLWVGSCTVKRAEPWQIVLINEI